MSIYKDLLFLHGFRIAPAPSGARAPYADPPATARPDPTRDPRARAADGDAGRAISHAPPHGVLSP